MSEETVVRTADNVVTSDNLAEWTANKLGLASEEAPSEAVVETLEREVSTEPEVEAQAESESEAEQEAEVTDKPKQNPKLEKRFSELTKRAKQAEAEKQALEARLQELERQQQPAPIQADPVSEKPQASQFNDAFEYAEALAEWSAEKALEQRDIQEQQRKIQEERNQVIQSWTQKLEKAKAELPDFDDMVSSSNVVVRDEVRDAILESDVGPQILYHLASDTDYAQKVASMPVAKALKELGKLESQYERKEAPVEKSEPVARTKAPAPIKPLTAGKGTGDVLIDGDGAFHGTYAQWTAARQAKRIR